MAVNAGPHNSPFETRRMSATLQPTARPPGNWVMAMRWQDLLFAHWPVPPELLQARLPAGLTADTFRGEGWIGVVPFRMSGVRARYCPAIPGLSAFPEINLRTYVRRNGKSGVYFFSLDAAHFIGVHTARWTYGLPYYRARMRCVPDGDGVVYESTRVHRGAPPARFAARYAPVGPPRASEPDTLEHFLTERYSLFTAGPSGTIRRARIHHEPWPLQQATWDPACNEMSGQVGITLPDTPPVLHFARRLDVVAWWPRRA
jgi:uncharacterized protein YqjF (DUF2071 family)